MNSHSPLRPTPAPHPDALRAQRPLSSADAAQPGLTPAPAIVYRPPRRRWAGVTAAAVIGAGLAALAVSSYYDDRSVGEKLDATVSNVRATVDEQVAGVKQTAVVAAENTAATGERVASTLADAGITASVKAALAADPSLSALKVSVDTRDGVVTLTGPAPDDKSRERAAVLAAAPEGVRSVINQLVVGHGSPGAATTTASGG